MDGMGQGAGPGVQAARLWRMQMISRRRFMALAGKTGAVAALGGLAAACQGGETNQGATPSGTGAQIPEGVPGPGPISGGQYGGRLVAGYSDGWHNFDPAIASGWMEYDSTQLVFSGGLVAYGGQSGGPVPNLAEAMPDISSDGKTFTFKIRPGVKFHNGREIEAEDFKYSIERMIKHPWAWGGPYYSSVVGYEAFYSGKAKTMEGFEVPDSRTFLIHLTQPDANIESVVACAFSFPVPREAVERLGKDFTNKPVGYGPFKFESLDEAGQRYVFSKFDDYLYKGLPYLDEVEMRWGMNNDLLLEQVTSGQIDFTGDGSSVFGRQGAANPSLEQYLAKMQIPMSDWVCLFSNYPPLDNVKARQALNWAVDRSQIERITSGTLVGWGYPFPKTLPIPHIVEPFGYDLTKAKQLLAEAGVPNGFEATLAMQQGGYWGTLPEFLQQQLAAVGVNVKLDPTSSITDVQSKRTEPMALTSWYMSLPEASDIIDLAYVTGSSSNYDQYSNPQLDELANQAKAEFDHDKRFAIYAEIEKIIMDNALNLFVSTASVILAKGLQVQNWHMRPEYQTYFDRVWLSS